MTGIDLTKTESKAPDVNKLDNSKLAKLLSMEKLVSKMFKEAAALAKARALDGEKIPGKKLVKDFGNRTWKDDTDFKALAEKLKMEPEDFYEQKQITAPAFEKVIKASFSGRSKLVDTARKNALAVYEKQVVTPEKGAKLVPEEANGESYLPEAFEDIE